MRSKLFLLFVVLSVCLSVRAQTVNENGVQVILNEKKARVLLPVDSPADQHEAAIHIDLLDPSDRVKASADSKSPLVKGVNMIEAPIDISSIASDREFRFYRLRYEINGKTGLVSLARCAADIFDLEAFSFDFPQSNSRYMVRVRAIHPVTLKGVGRVTLEGKLSLEFGNSGEKEIEVQTTTDADGFADLTFTLPEFDKLEDLDLKITGTKNGVVNYVQRELPEYAFNRFSAIYFQTDKPIYQPGQVLRVRSLLFNEKKKAIADDPLTFTIKDGDGTVMSKIEARTSRFGIASVEWQIPDNVKLGKYTIVLGSERQMRRTEKTFTISRYDLPNFSVAAEAERKYYLPDQKTASVKVGADYLFGKPVTNAKVRVVEESERHWNYKQQKYDTKEGQVREGILDATGKFTAEFDLEDAHNGFRTTYYGNFRDLNFAAYVTDLTTNKTEQRRFDIRITARPIHLYLSRDYDDYQISRHLPGRFYVTAFYADGTPAECDFSIYEQSENSYNEDDPKTGRVLARGRTNRLGAARAIIPLNSLDTGDNSVDLVIKARDRGDNKGLATDQLRFDDLKPAVQVSTNKIAYGEGEPINVELVSSERETTLFLSVTRDKEVLVNEKLRIQGGKAAITIPYAEGMKGPLTISAYGSYRNSWGAAATFSGTRTVLFPSPPEGMTLTARSAKNSYRPGEEATVELVSSMTGGRAEESVFGVSVIDKAIDERARTDADFGGGYASFYDDFLGLLDEAPGAVTSNIDTSNPLSAEAELALEIALRRRFYPELLSSGNFRSDLNNSFYRKFERQFYGVSASLSRRFSKDKLAAVDETSLRNILAIDEIDLDTMLDPWGNRFQISVTPIGAYSTIAIKSAGADEIYGTPDDLTALQRQFAYFYGTGTIIDRAFFEYERRTGSFIRDYDSLRDELRRQNFDLDTLRDAWGKPYRFKFDVEGNKYVLKIDSGGADRKFGRYDDFTAWTHNTDYFTVTRAKMAAGIRDFVKKTGAFPADENEFLAVLADIGFDLAELKDAFGRQYYVVKETKARYTDRKKIGNTKTEITPVTQDLVIYTIKSVGGDGLRGSADDFELTRFVGIVAEKRPDGTTDNRVKAVPSSRSGWGGLTGTITDANGAIIAGANVFAHMVKEGRYFSVRTDENGRFILSDLPPGTYEIHIDSPGFKKLMIQGAIVESEIITEIDSTLEVGSISETVEVVGQSEIDQSSSTSGANIST